MKLKIALLILSLAFSARAQTNEIIVPEVTVAGTTYTNATVRRLNPAEAVIWCDEFNKKVFTSQLPNAIQSQFGYNADAAQQFIETRSEQDAAFRLRYAQAMAAARQAELAHEKQIEAQQQAIDAAAAANNTGKKAKGSKAGKSGAPPASQ